MQTSVITAPLENVGLTIAEWEWSCGSCGTLNIETGDDPGRTFCTKCMVPYDGEMSISGCTWKCPECSEEHYCGFPPALTVKCPSCGGTFLAGEVVRKTASVQNPIPATMELALAELSPIEDVPFLPEEMPEEVVGAPVISTDRVLSPLPVSVGTRPGKKSRPRKTKSTQYSLFG